MLKDILFILGLALALLLVATHYAEAGEKADDTVLVDEQVLCPTGEVCNVDLTVVLAPPEPMPALAPAPKPEKRHDRVSALVEYVLLPAGGAAAGAGLFSALWPTEFNGVDNTLDYGSAWKGALIGVGVGLALGVLVDLLDD